MGKITEMNNRTKTLSAQDQYDETFHGEYSPEDMEEAVFIEREIQDIPDREEWEPTEEKFQALLARAKENSLITEKEDAMGMADSQKNQSRREKKIHKINKITIRKRVMKWSAVAAAVVIGVFGVSMSSEANRAYIMQEVNKMFGNDVNTELDNVEVLESDRTEEYARQEIENTLGVKVPMFYYMPPEMIYQNHEIDKQAQFAFMQYQYEEQVIYLMIFANDKDMSRLSRDDSGEYIGEVNSELPPNIKSSLWKIFEDGDEEPTYSLKWMYKNIYFEFFGKLRKEEIEEIGRQIYY